MAVARRPPPAGGSRRAPRLSRVQYNIGKAKARAFGFTVTYNSKHFSNVIEYNITDVTKYNMIFIDVLC